MALNPFQQGDDFGGFPADDQFGDSLGVTRASSLDLAGGHDAFVDIERNGTGTGSVGLVDGHGRFFSKLKWPLSLSVFNGLGKMVLGLG